MKTPSSIFGLASAVFLLSALSPSRFADAADCTAEHLSKIHRVYRSAALDGTLTCFSYAVVPNLCDNATCLDFLSELVDALPDCNASGLIAKEHATATLECCDNLAAGTTDASAVDATHSTADPSAADTSNPVPDVTAEAAADPNSNTTVLSSSSLSSDEVGTPASTASAEGASDSSAHDTTRTAEGTNTATSFVLALLSTNAATINLALGLTSSLLAFGQ